MIPRTVETANARHSERSRSWVRIALAGFLAVAADTNVASADNPGVLIGRRGDGYSRHDREDLRQLRNDLGSLARDSRDLYRDLSNRFRHGSPSKETKRSLERFVKHAHEALDEADDRNPSLRSIQKELSQLRQAAEQADRDVHDDRRLTRNFVREWEQLHDRADDIVRDFNRYFDRRNDGYWNNGHYENTGGGYWNNGSGWIPRPRDPHTGSNGGNWNNSGNYGGYYPPSGGTPRPQNSPWVIPPGSPGIPVDEWKKRQFGF